MSVLMEATPDEIDLNVVHRNLANCTGVTKVHDLHIWCLTAGSRYILTVHLNSSNPAASLRAA